MMSRVFLLSVALAFRLGAQQPDTGAKPAADTAIGDTTFTHARQLVLEGNGTAGRAIVDSAVARTPEGTPAYAEALYWRAMLAATAADAERDYRRIIVEYPISPRAADALFSLAQLEMSRGDRESAAAHLERFMRDHPASPDHGRAGLALSRLLLEQGRVARGCATLARARTSVPPDAVELRNQYDYYGQRCIGVDTVEAVVAARPASRASAPASVPAKSAAPESARGATRGAAPAASPAAPPAATGGSAMYTLQVAAYQTKAEADRLVDRLNARGYTARVYGSARPFRVRIGRFRSEAAATDLLKRLRAQGVTGFVTTAEQEPR